MTLTEYITDCCLGKQIVIIDECMTLARDREHFIRLMEYNGYEVKWTDGRKNITYTTPRRSQVPGQ